MAQREDSRRSKLSRRSFLSSAVTTGVAAATGVRVRELPVRIEHLLA